MLRSMRRISLTGLLLAVVLSACSSAPATTAPACTCGGSDHRTHGRADGRSD